MSKKLATIKLDVPVAYQEAEFALDAKAGALTAFYQKYQMRSLARQVGKLADIIGGEAGEEQEAEAQPLLAMPQMKEATALEAGREMYQQAVKAGKAFVMGDFEVLSLTLIFI